MQILVIIQARMSSVRFPQKMMRKVMGMPLYLLIYRRCQLIKNISEVVIATSEMKEDDILANHGQMNDCKVYRGPLDDVIKRFIDCGRKYGADSIIRVCGDSPFLDVQWVSDEIEHFCANKLDYVGWDAEHRLPGLDSEIIRLKVLEEIYESDPSPEEREHVTLRIRKNPGNFRSHFFEWKGSLKKLGSTHLTVDSRVDWERINWVSRVLSEREAGLQFSCNEVVQLLHSMRQVNGCSSGR